MINDDDDDDVDDDDEEETDVEDENIHSECKNPR
jgi:hypothetical protein